MRNQSRWNGAVRWLAGMGLAVGLVSSAAAQRGWFFECIDPENEEPYSNPYGIIGVDNQLMGIRMGTVGTVTYGGETGPCYAPSARTLPAPGRFAFGVPGEGSVQSTFDDGMAYTVGWPQDPVGSFSYAQIDKGLTEDGDGNRFGFGLGGLRGSFVGASNRYFVALGGDNEVDVRLTVRVIGDAARLQWDLRNVTGTTRTLGLRFGAYVGMRTGDPSVVDVTGNNQANSLLSTLTGADPDQNFIVGKQTPEGYVGWNITPTTKPLRTGRNFLRRSPNFPAWAKFMFGQTEAYGSRVENTDQAIKDQTPVDQFIVDDFGDGQFPGLLRNNEGGDDNWIRNRIFQDFSTGDPLLDPNAPPPLEENDSLLNEVAFAQVWAPANVVPGGTRTIVHYVRSVWSVGDYEDPYTALVDAPRLIASDQGQGEGQNGLEPNPFRIVVYVDNQFAQIDKEVPLNDVRISLKVGNGLQLADGEPSTKVIARIGPNVISDISWEVEATGEISGYIPWEVTIQPTPGPQKTLKGNVLVAATPQVFLGEGPNLITLPWGYADTSLDQVFGLVSGRDYVAYRWDADVNGYTAAVSAERGRGIWVVPTSDLGLRALQGSITPPDIPSGGLAVNLKRGWNLIGNPYNYPVPLAQLTGVADDNPRQSFTWQEMVTLGFVSNSLAFWERDPNDPGDGVYRFTQGVETLLQPHVGYWVFVNTSRPVRIFWPAVFLEELPNSGRSSEEQWRQTDRQWRLELVARTNESIDAENYVGVAANRETANRLRLPKPPPAPGQKLELSVVDTADAEATRLTHSFADRMGRKEWKVMVRSEKSGEVTLTWPTLSSIPRNVRFRIVDEAAGTTRDLRMLSGYTVNFDQPGTRELKLQMEPGAAARPVIGNVIVGRAGRDRNSPLTLTYSLSAEASTTIRVLTAGGREVFTVTRGRADRVGENTATWLLRDNADRAVAPGNYRIEIIAETPTGERVRKIVPVNVVR